MFLLGWAKSGTNSETYEGGYSWSWDRCNVNFWQEWIRTYGDEQDASKLRMFKIPEMHLSHEHPFHLWYNENLPEEAKEQCYGKDTKGGWLGVGIPNIRYLIWYKWKFILCEKWFLAPAEKYWIKLLNNIHHHMLALYSVPIEKNWKWDVNTEKWIKKYQPKNQGNLLNCI